MPKPTSPTHSHQPAKISAEFAARLAALAPRQTVRVIVLPAPYLHGGSGARVHGETRQTRVREARTRTEQTFAEVDAILAHCGGHRVTECGNALGFILVETTVDGVWALTDLGWVGTVMEDQPVRPAHQAAAEP
jgi:hypothetical protein